MGEYMGTSLQRARPVIFSVRSYPPTTENEHLRPVRLFPADGLFPISGSEICLFAVPSAHCLLQAAHSSLVPTFYSSQANNINLPADFENVEPELEGSVGHLGNYPTGATKTFLNSNLNWVIKPVGLTTAVYSIGNIPITLIQTTVG